MQTVASLVSTVQDLMEELKIPAGTALDNRILGSLAIPSSTGVPVLQTTEVPCCCISPFRPIGCEICWTRFRYLHN